MRGDTRSLDESSDDRCSVVSFITSAAAAVRTLGFRVSGLKVQQSRENNLHRMLLTSGSLGIRE